MDLPISQLRGQFRIGRVSAVKDGEHRVEVKFAEQDGFVSWDMPVLVTRPDDYALPTKDALVLCVIMEGILGNGYVLGVIYNESDAAPLDDAGKRSVASDDLRLGTSDASDKVALAPKCKDNFDKIDQELTKISTTLASLTGGAMTPAVFGTPYTKGYSPTDPAAENVSAK
jgi:hypothetical protein